MTCHFVRFFWLTAALFLAACAVFPSTAFAQGPLPDAPTPSLEFAPLVANRTPPNLANEHIGERLGEHRFWDAENIALFAAVGATSGADFAFTRSNLQKGGRELNPVVRLFGRSTPGLAVNFCGETVGVIGVGYFFHKTGHHRLERMVSMVNIGISAGAASYSATHR
jgi:hypothetical protein